MEFTYIPKEEDVFFIKTPVYAWKYSFGGDFWYNVEEGKEPSVFYRIMQRLVLGIIWKKYK